MLSPWSGETVFAPHYTEVLDIHVLREFRQRGIGRALLDHAKGLADELDWDSLTATVWAGNTASKRLFEEFGYTPLNVTYRIGPDRQCQDWPDPVAPSPGYGLWTWALILAACAFAYFIGQS